MPYDRVILATGSNPVVLPLPGKELPGVVTYRDIADVDKMIAASREHKHAIVIGGGLLGLEAAYGLQKRGMAVTVVHLVPTLMERQLDARGRRALEALARAARAQVPDAGPDGRDRRRRPRRGGALRGWQRAAGRPRRDGRRHPAELRAREGERHRVRARRARERHDADIRPAHLRARRMRSAPRHLLRARRAVVRAGEGARESSRRVRHRPLPRIANVDEAQGDGHRSLLRRRFQRRRGHGRARVPGRRARRLQENRAEGQQDPRRRALRRHGRRRVVLPAIARRHADRGFPRDAAVRPSASRRLRARRRGSGHELARQGRDLRLQRRLQGRHREGDHVEEPVHARRGSGAYQSVFLLRFVHGPRRATSREHPRRRLLRRACEEAHVPVHDLHARGGARKRSSASD